MTSYENTAQSDGQADTVSQPGGAAYLGTTPQAAP